MEISDSEEEMEWNHDAEKDDAPPPLDEPTEPKESIVTPAASSECAGQPVESERSRNLRAFFKAHQFIPAENSTIIRGREGLEVLPASTRSEEDLVGLMADLSVASMEKLQKQANLIQP